MRRTISLIALPCLVLAFAAGTGRALDASDLCFYAPYDGSLNAFYAAGDAKPREVCGEHKFVPGILGQAVIAGEPGTELAYAVGRNLPGHKGTISIWIKTIDWSAGDFKGHSIVTVPDKFLFYHASHSGGIHLEWLEKWGGSTYTYPQGPVKDEWKHLVYTWGDGGVTLYQNGQFVSRIDLTNRVYFPYSPKEFPEVAADLLFHVCDPSLTSDGKNTAVIDELMMFNRPLDAVEVKSLYRSVAVRSPELLETWRAGILVANLGSAAPKGVYRGTLQRLPETIARIGYAKRPPKIDGTSGPGEWHGSAEFCDFTDVPFGNLTTRSIRANISYDKNALYVCVRSRESSPPNGVFDTVAISLRRTTNDKPCLFYVGPYSPTLKSVGDEWGRTSARGTVGESKRIRTFEIAVPWSEIGMSAPKTGDSVRLSIMRTWSPDLSDKVTWPVQAGGWSEAASFAKLVFGGSKPALCLTGLGKLNYAQLNLQAGASVNMFGWKAEVRLQPSDLREYYDPKTLPGTKSYTGARIVLDKDLKLKHVPNLLWAPHSFSDTDINSLWLKVTDASGDVVYQAQRSFVPRPPITISVKTFPEHGRLRIDADVSNYHESPLKDLSAEIRLSGPSGKIAKTASITTFRTARESVQLPLSPLPDGKITALAILRRGKTNISQFATSFDKLPRGPWLGNKLGKDDIVIPPFTPIEVDGQRVSVWGRTYTWDNSLFPIQITSGGQDLLAGPIELIAGAEAAGKPNPAVVTIVESKPTRTIVEATGMLDGIRVTARHLIEYDGMCLTTLNFKAPVRLDSLTLRIPYKRERSTLYMMSWEPWSGAVRETSNPICPPMNGKKDYPFKNTVWLGSEDRGMTWFTEDGKGWIFQDNPTPVGVAADESVTTLTLRFSTTPLRLEKPLTLTFGIIATPVKPMRDNWRFLRNTRDWGYRWYGVFTAANNDIAHPFPSYKEFLAEQHKTIPLHVPYQMPVYANIRQPEVTYYGEEWMFPPRQIVGNDEGDEERHLAVCLGGGWADFMVFYAVKAYDDLRMDGYYLDGALPDGRGCTNALHGHGWADSGGNPRGTYSILANREFFKRLAVEFYKRGRPYLMFVHLSGCVEMPTFSFADMGWNGEQFSTSATSARDYNKLLSLPYFRTQFTGAQFGIPIQLLLEYWKKEGAEPIGTAEIDTVLGLSLAHGVGDNLMAGNFYSQENWTYAKTVLDAQDSFGIREKDCKFLPYWSNSEFVTVEPANENIVCSIWRRSGKALLVLNNSTPQDQQIQVQLNLTALGLEGPELTVGRGSPNPRPPVVAELSLRAADLITGKTETIEGGALRVLVKKSNWRLIVVSTPK